jgi:hypothetical protein
MKLEDDDILLKCRVIYKGDYLAGAFYVFIGILMLVLGWGLSFWSKFGMGFHILSTGFFFLTVYGIGKGIAMIIIALTRYTFYMKIQKIDLTTLVQEREYTAYRIQKKSSNRRKYIYITVIASLIAFVGIFSSQKGFYTGTAIPIALISGIEFTIGLLTEFRLNEFFRQLQKSSNHLST